MNKYLEKIAAKIELEPGVNYDLAKHDIAVSRQRMSDHINSKDQTSRLITGGMFGALGGTAGYIHATQRIKNDNYLAQPQMENSLVNPTKADFDSWRSKRPDMLKGVSPEMASDLHRRLDDYTHGRSATHGLPEEYVKWHSERPTMYTKKVLSPGANNLVGRLVAKHGIGRVLSAGKALGGLAGAAAMGGFGYLTGGADDEAKADYKNSYLHHLEKKHDAKIHELEGWG